MNEASSGAACETIRAHRRSDSSTANGQRDDERIVFISDAASPFAQRTWMALEHRGIDYEYREASKAQKASDDNTLHPNELLPCIQVPQSWGGGLIRGSIPCIEFLEEAFPNHPPLFSKNLVDRARERVWIDWIRRTCIPTFMRVLRAKERDRLQASALNLCKILDTFAAEIREPYFSGNSITMPDVVLAPFILRTRRKISNRSFHNTRPADAAACQKYQTYAARVLKVDALVRTSPDEEEPIECPSPPVRLNSAAAPKLPPEIIGHILSFTNDYELAVTLGLPRALPETAPWKEQSTLLDRAILSGQLNEVKRVFRGDPLSKTTPTEAHTRFTHWGARCMLRFGYTHLLDWLYSVTPDLMHDVCDELLPEVASAWGRVEVLEWAYRGSSFGLPTGNNHAGLLSQPLPTPGTSHMAGFSFTNPSTGTRNGPSSKPLSPRAIDDASRNGHVEILEWWLNSGISPLSYSEDALNHATIKKQLPTLEWWIASGLPLKLGNVLDFASMVKDGSTDSLEWWHRKSGLSGGYSKIALYEISKKGNTRLLDWWKSSGLPLVYDKEVLIGATRMGQVASLDWWLHSKLPVSYTFFDIEEAIEDSIQGRERVEAWWQKNGLRRSANAQTWTRTRTLGKW